MTVASTGASTPIPTTRANRAARSSVFDIKSASIDGLGLLLKSANMVAIEGDLKVRFANGSAEGTPMLIDVSALTASGTDRELDLPLLVSLLKSFSLQPVGIVGAKDGLLEMALAMGMTEESNIGHLSGRGAKELAADQKPAAVAAPRAVVAQASNDAQVQRAVDSAVLAAVSSMVNAPQIIDKPVRSGQRIYAKGGDLIVLNSVGHGAEVIADGNVHVYGPLRGRAIAGAQGNQKARIFALSMEPDLYAIAGIFSTTDIPLPLDVQGKTAQIVMENDRLVAKPLKA